MLQMRFPWDYISFDAYVSSAARLSRACLVVVFTTSELTPIGDFNLAFLDLIDDVDGLKWSGNCNELNAAYSADGKSP